MKVPQTLAASPPVWRQRLIFGVIGASVLMTNVDLWVVNVALESIGENLSGSSLAGLSWIVTAYAMTLAAFLIIAGRMGDRSGHRQIFLIGTAVFTLASLGCAIAPNLWFMIGMRILQAIGAAMQLPASLALLMASVSVDRRHSAARLWSSIGAVAAASGPVVGGLLIDFSWRWIFIINVPIGVAVIVLGIRTIPKTLAHSREALPDLVGSVLLALSIAAVTGGIVQGPEWGWTSPSVLGLLLVAIVAVAWFIRRCATQPVPLFELGIWRVRAFSIANISVFLFWISFAMQLLANVLWCQGVWQYSALKTGLAMAPGPALVPFVAIASNRAVRRFGAGPVIAVGAVLFAFGQLWRVFLAEVEPDYLRDFLPSMLLSGVGVGLAFSTLIASGSTALPGSRAGTGAAVLNTGRQIASVIGVAVLVALLGNSGIGDDSLGSFDVAWVIAAILVLFSAGVSLYLPREMAAGSIRRPTVAIISPATTGD